MSGGAGTRLWPLSRNSRPKQFLTLDDDYSLFQNTVLRCKGECFDDRPIIIGANDHRFLIAEDLNALGCQADILLEPVARNSCAAIVAGCFQALERDAQAIVLVLAADHLIHDVKGFAGSVTAAINATSDGKLITFGVRPGFPSTAYGYILPGAKLDQHGGMAVSAFVEKPDETLAKQYMDEGYFWNSGNFMFRADAFLAEAKIHVPEIIQAVSDAHCAKIADLDFLRLDAASFEKSPSISVDYAIMEKTGKAAVFPANHDWSDIGSWNSVWRNLPREERGNAVLGDAVIIDGENNLVHSQGKLTTLVGVNETIVVVTRDTVLVADQSQSEMVKELVTDLRKNGRNEADAALKIFRPWGNYERLDEGIHYQVKRIIIKPDGVLSLQKHEHRAEHWVVVQGNPEVTINDSVNTLQPNQSVYIPLGTIHRLANHNKEDVVLIEVQTGEYLGEDDIIRIEDNYNRTDSD